MCILCCVFFFKQKTAYEMRISDWSSDVCSSDLFCAGVACGPDRGQGGLETLGRGDLAVVVDRHVQIFANQHALVAQIEVTHADDGHGGTPVAGLGSATKAPTAYCPVHREAMQTPTGGRGVAAAGAPSSDCGTTTIIHRSEERRGGKECVRTGRSR